MSVELRPLGVACNLRCAYCYQVPQRDLGPADRSYDLDAMKAAVEVEGGPFTLFGGEALLVPEEDLEALWSWGFERYGSNSVQTNGVAINDAHVRMFHRYRVHVGISIDGPGELNDARRHGSLERTRQATARTEQAIERLCREGIPPSLIVTLHRGNATADKLPVMHRWLRRLDEMGVTSVRLHVLEVDSREVGDQWALSAEDNIDAFRGFALLEEHLATLRFDVFADMRDLLMGTDDATTCVWNACDPYTTGAVRGVEGYGRASNCGRVNKDGIDYLKATVPGYERPLALYRTPQGDGGCAGCRFFLMCKGQCPGTAIDGDWRNRSSQCSVWKQLLRDAEEQLLDAGELPLSVSPERIGIEADLVGQWVDGGTATIAEILRRRTDGRHPAADTGAESSGATSAHGDAAHGDVPHADRPHGDG